MRRNDGSYRYKAPAPSSITSVLLKTDKLVVRGGYQFLSYTLDEPQQGRVAVRVTLPDGTGWCAEAPAKASGSPPSTASSDRVDRFVAQPKSPAPAVCPPAPGGSPSGAFVAEPGGQAAARTSPGRLA